MGWVGGYARREARGERGEGKGEEGLVGIEKPTSKASGIDQMEAWEGDRKSVV